MKLKDYRTNIAKLSRARFGKLIGVTGISIWRYETGRCVPEPETLKKIAKVTGGQVTPNDMLGVGK